MTRLKKVAAIGIINCIMLLTGISTASAEITRFHVTAPAVACVNEVVTFVINVMNKGGTLAAGYNGTKISWGDGSLPTPHYGPNGVPVTATHVWTALGTYQWIAEAEDGTYGAGEFPTRSGTITIINCNGNLIPTPVLAPHRPVDIAVPSSNGTVGSVSAVNGPAEVEVTVPPYVCTGFCIGNRITVHWGDGTTSERNIFPGIYPNGIVLSFSHSYPLDGIHDPTTDTYQWIWRAAVYNSVGRSSTADVYHLC